LKLENLVMFDNNKNAKLIDLDNALMIGEPPRTSAVGVFLPGKRWFPPRAPPVAASPTVALCTHLARLLGAIGAFCRRRCVPLVLPYSSVMDDTADAAATSGAAGASRRGARRSVVNAPVHSAAAAAAVTTTAPRHSSYSAAVSRISDKSVPAEVLQARKDGCASLRASMRTGGVPHEQLIAPLKLVTADASSRKLPPPKAFAEAFVRTIGRFAVALMSPSGSALEVFFSTDEAKQAALDQRELQVDSAKFIWRTSTQDQSGDRRGAQGRRVFFRYITPSFSLESLKTHVARFSTLLGDLHEQETLNVGTGIFSGLLRINDDVDIDKIPQRIRTEHGWITMSIDGQKQQCFACASTEHKIADCTKKNACFNCGGSGHAARSCRSPVQKPEDNLSLLPRMRSDVRASASSSTPSRSRPSSATVRDSRAQIETIPPVSTSNSILPLPSTPMQDKVVLVQGGDASDMTTDPNVSISCPSSVASSTSLLSTVAPPHVNTAFVVPEPAAPTKRPFEDVMAGSDSSTVHDETESVQDINAFNDADDNADDDDEDDDDYDDDDDDDDDVYDNNIELDPEGGPVRINSDPPHASRDSTMPGSSRQHRASTFEMAAIPVTNVPPGVSQVADLASVSTTTHAKSTATATTSQTTAQ
jgi:hypothetical protein